MSKPTISIITILFIALITASAYALSVSDETLYTWNEDRSTLRDGGNDILTKGNGGWYQNGNLVLREYAGTNKYEIINYETINGTAVEKSRTLYAYTDDPGIKIVKLDDGTYNLASSLAASSIQRYSINFNSEDGAYVSGMSFSVVNGKVNETAFYKGFENATMEQIADDSAWRRDADDNVTFRYSPLDSPLSAREITLDITKSGASMTIRETDVGISDGYEVLTDRTTASGPTIQSVRPIGEGTRTIGVSTYENIRRAAVLVPQPPPPVEATLETVDKDDARNTTIVKMLGTAVLEKTERRERGGYEVKAYTKDGNTTYSLVYGDKTVGLNGVREFSALSGPGAGEIEKREDGSYFIRVIDQTTKDTAIDYSIGDSGVTQGQSFSMEENLVSVQVNYSQTAYDKVEVGRSTVWKTLFKGVGDTAPRARSVLIEDPQSALGITVYMDSYTSSIVAKVPTDKLSYTTYKYEGFGSGYPTKIDHFTGGTLKLDLEGIQVKVNPDYRYRDNSTSYIYRRDTDPDGYRKIELVAEVVYDTDISKAGLIARQVTIKPKMADGAIRFPTHDYQSVNGEPVFKYFSTVTINATLAQLDSGSWYYEGGKIAFSYGLNEDSTQVATLYINIDTGAITGTKISFYATEYRRLMGTIEREAGSDKVVVKNGSGVSIAEVTIPDNAAGDWRYENGNIIFRTPGADEKRSSEIRINTASGAVSDHAVISRDRYTLDNNITAGTYDIKITDDPSLGTISIYRDVFDNLSDGTMTMLKSDGVVVFRKTVTTDASGASLSAGTSRIIEYQLTSRGATRYDITSRQGDAYSVYKMYENGSATPTQYFMRDNTTGNITVMNTRTFEAAGKSMTISYALKDGALVGLEGYPALAALPVAMLVNDSAWSVADNKVRIEYGFTVNSGAATETRTRTIMLDIAGASLAKTSDTDTFARSGYQLIRDNMDSKSYYKENGAPESIEITAPQYNRIVSAGPSADVALAAGVISITADNEKAGYKLAETRRYIADGSQSGDPAYTITMTGGRPRTLEPALFDELTDTNSKVRIDTIAGGNTQIVLQNNVGDVGLEKVYEPDGANGMEPTFRLTFGGASKTIEQSVYNKMLGLDVGTGASGTSVGGAGFAFTALEPAPPVSDYIVVGSKAGANMTDAYVVAKTASGLKVNPIVGGYRTVLTEVTPNSTLGPTTTTYALDKSTGYYDTVEASAREYSVTSYYKKPLTLTKTTKNSGNDITYTLSDRSATGNITGDQYDSLLNGISFVRQTDMSTDIKGAGPAVYRLMNEGQGPIVIATVVSTDRNGFTLDECQKFDGSYSYYIRTDGYNTARMDKSQYDSLNSSDASVQRQGAGYVIMSDKDGVKYCVTLEYGNKSVKTIVGEPAIYAEKTGYSIDEYTMSDGSKAYFIRTGTGADEKLVKVNLDQANALSADGASIQRKGADYILMQGYIDGAPVDYFVTQSGSGSAITPLTNIDVYQKEGYSVEIYNTYGYPAAFILRTADNVEVRLDGISAVGFSAEGSAMLGKGDDYIVMRSELSDGGSFLSYITLSETGGVVEGVSNTEEYSSKDGYAIDQYYLYNGSVLNFLKTDNKLIRIDDAQMAALSSEGATILGQGADFMIVRGYSDGNEVDYYVGMSDTGSVLSDILTTVEYSGNDYYALDLYFMSDGTTANFMRTSDNKLVKIDDAQLLALSSNSAAVLGQGADFMIVRGYSDGSPVDYYVALSGTANTIKITNGTYENAERDGLAIGKYTIADGTTLYFKRTSDNKFSEIAAAEYNSIVSGWSEETDDTLGNPPITDAGIIVSIVATTSAPGVTFYQDESGNIVAASLDSGEQVRYEYDDSGRPSKTTYYNSPLIADNLGDGKYRIPTPDSAALGAVERYFYNSSGSLLGTVQYSEGSDAFLMSNNKSMALNINLPVSRLESGSWQVDGDRIIFTDRTGGLTYTYAYSDSGVVTQATLQDSEGGITTINYVDGLARSVFDSAGGQIMSFNYYDENWEPSTTNVAKIFVNFYGGLPSEELSGPTDFPVLLEKYRQGMDLRDAALNEFSARSGISKDYTYVSSMTKNGDVWFVDVSGGYGVVGSYAMRLSGGLAVIEKLYYGDDASMESYSINFDNGLVDTIYRYTNQGQQVTIFTYGEGQVRASANLSKMPVTMTETYNGDMADPNQLVARTYYKGTAGSEVVDHLCPYTQRENQIMALPEQYTTEGAEPGSVWVLENGARPDFSDYALKAGEVYGDAETKIEKTIDLTNTGDSILAFDWKVGAGDGKSMAYKIFMDGGEAPIAEGNIGGGTDWMANTPVNLAGGHSYRVEWIYKNSGAKDASAADTIGQTAWVDNVRVQQISAPSFQNYGFMQSVNQALGDFDSYDGNWYMKSGGWASGLVINPDGKVHKLTKAISIGVNGGTFSFEGGSESGGAIGGGIVRYTITRSGGEYVAGGYIDRPGRYTPNWSKTYSFNLGEGDYQVVWETLYGPDWYNAGTVGIRYISVTGAKAGENKDAFYHATDRLGVPYTEFYLYGNNLDPAGSANAADPKRKIVRYSGELDSPEGNPISESLLDGPKGSEYIKQTTTYTYNSVGALILTVRQNIDNGAITSTETINPMALDSSDDEAYRTVEAYASFNASAPMEQPVLSSVKTYYANGDLKSEKIYDSENKIQSQTIYKYNGELRGERRYTYDGNGNSLTYTSYVYDKDGNKVGDGVEAEYIYINGIKKVSASETYNAGVLTYSADFTYDEDTAYLKSSSKSWYSGGALYLTEGYSKLIEDDVDSATTWKTFERVELYPGTDKTHITWSSDIIQTNFKLVKNEDGSDYIITVRDNATKEVFDENGVLSTRTLYEYSEGSAGMFSYHSYENESMISTKTTWEYNGTATYNKKTVSEYTDIDGKRDTITTREYSDDTTCTGKTVSKYTYKDAWLVEKITTLTYSDETTYAGKKVSIYTYDSMNSVTTETVSEYDASDQLVTESIYDGAGQLTSKNEYMYYSDGLVAQKTAVNYLASGSEPYRTIERYANGEVTSTAYYDINGNEISQDDSGDAIAAATNQFVNMMTADDIDVNKDDLTVDAAYDDAGGYVVSISWSYDDDMTFYNTYAIDASASSTINQWTSTLMVTTPWTYYDGEKEDYVACELFDFYDSGEVSYSGKTYKYDMLFEYDDGADFWTITGDGSSPMGTIEVDDDNDGNYDRRLGIVYDGVEGDEAELTIVDKDTNTSVSDVVKREITGAITEVVTLQKLNQSSSQAVASSDGAQLFDLKAAKAAALAQPYQSGEDMETTSEALKKSTP